jgi:hypothetical protein
MLAAKELGAVLATVYTGMTEKFPAPNRLYESLGLGRWGRSTCGKIHYKSFQKND